MANDDESTGIYPHDAHKCSNERRLRVLERKVDEHADRLIEGTRIMARLTLTVESLTKSVDILSSKIAEQAVERAKPNPLAQKIVESVIGALVPIAIIMIVWAAVSSGAVPIKAPATPPSQGTPP